VEPSRGGSVRGLAAGAYGPALAGCGLWYRPEPLRELWTGAGLDNVAVQAIEVPTVFADFDDDWRPFLGGQGPAPGYVMSLTDEHRRALHELLRARLPAGPDGAIPLTARAWAVRGRRPGSSRTAPGGRSTA
jgi:hypothetical protein